MTNGICKDAWTFPIRTTKNGMSGYPDGLNGEQIPVAARIFAIVDVRGALRSDRPTDSPGVRQTCGAILRDQSGSHFDPKVVDVFLNDGLPRLDEVYLATS